MSGFIDGQKCLMEQLSFNLYQQRTVTLIRNRKNYNTFDTKTVEWLSLSQTKLYCKFPTRFPKSHARVYILALM